MERIPAEKENYRKKKETCNILDVQVSRRYKMSSINWNAYKPCIPCHEILFKLTRFIVLEVFDLSDIHTLFISNCDMN